MSLFTFNEDAVATLNGRVVADHRDMLKLGQKHATSAAKSAEDYKAQLQAKAARKAERDEKIQAGLGKSAKVFGKQRTRALNSIDAREEGINKIIRTKGLDYKSAAAEFYKTVGDAANSGDASSGGSSIGNKLKWVFTKIKQLFLKLIKAIVSALASIQNKFRSKK